MSELIRIPAPEGVAPAAQYSHVVRGTGHFVAISGQLALDEAGGVVGEGDPAAQARQVFENLRRCLAAAGATFDDVIKLTCFVTDMACMPAIREARAVHVPDDRLPAVSAVQVVSLVRPEALMEIEAFAVVAEYPNVVAAPQAPRHGEGPIPHGRPQW